MPSLSRQAQSLCLISFLHYKFCYLCLCRQPFHILAIHLFYKSTEVSTFSSDVPWWFVQIFDFPLFNYFLIIFCWILKCSRSANLLLFLVSQSVFSVDLISFFWSMFGFISVASLHHQGIYIYYCKSCNISLNAIHCLFIPIPCNADSQWTSLTFPHSIIISFA